MSCGALFSVSRKSLHDLRMFRHFVPSRQPPVRGFFEWSVVHKNRGTPQKFAKQSFVGKVRSDGGMKNPPGSQGTRGVLHGPESAEAAGPP